MATSTVTRMPSRKASKTCDWRKEINDATRRQMGDYLVEDALGESSGWAENVVAGAAVPPQAPWYAPTTPRRQAGHWQRARTVAPCHPRPGRPGRPARSVRKLSQKAMLGGLRKPLAEESRPSPALTYSRAGFWVRRLPASTRYPTPAPPPTPPALSLEPSAAAAGISVRHTRPGRLSPDLSRPATGAA